MMRKATRFTVSLLIIIASLVYASNLSQSQQGHDGLGHSVNSSLQSQSQADPPNTIDGNVNLELIPDHIAYIMVFRSIATPQNTDLEKRRSRAWAKSIGFNDAVIDKLLAVANEFHTRVSVLDNQVKEIKDRSWPNPSTQVMEQLADLQGQKEAIVAEIITSLPTQLGTEDTKKLRQHVNNHVKRKVKLVPSLTSP